MPAIENLHIEVLAGRNGRVADHHDRHGELSKEREFVHQFAGSDTDLAILRQRKFQSPRQD